MILKKLNRFVLALCWTCLQLVGISNNINAQDLPTVNLEAVEIAGSRLSPFAIGAATISFDSSLINIEALPNLSDLITYHTAIAVKTYGNGMLSSISFRGTGASHTAVLWHGINISYPMLGQSDLSMLSLALSDQVKIQSGTGSALYGSGALGGTVSLSNMMPATGIGVSLSQWVGSYGTIKNNIQVSFANDKFFFKIRTLYDQSDNEFKFKNITKPGEPIEVQKGADYRIFGTSLESGAAVGERGKLNFSFQFLSANRNLQPSMNANGMPDNQTDENIRVRTKYQVIGDKLLWNLNYAYLHDVIGFNGAKTTAKHQVLRSELETILFSAVTINIAGDFTFVEINSPFYEADKTKENRANLWASFLLNPVDRLLLSLNLRQSFGPQYKIPFTPSFGAEYLLIKKPKHQLQLKSLLARGFRVPTLNEQYWQPGGNLDLEPENSYSFELGLAGKLKSNLYFEYELTGYRMWVENWILWRPNGSIWTPENVKQVDGYGIETNSSIRHKIGFAKIMWRVNYAYTRSINRTGLDQFDRSVNKQLAYVPVHKATISSIIDLSSWSLLVNGAYNGRRYVTADNEESLPDYFLLNLRLGKSFKKGNYLISGHANVNNIFNTSYQSVENKAMPGTNFLVGITLAYFKP